MLLIMQGNRKGRLRNQSPEQAPPTRARPGHAARCRAFDGITLPRAGIASTSCRSATVGASFRTGRAGRLSS